LSRVPGRSYIGLKQRREGQMPLPTFISLNDKHQSEGGTLVFVGANNTIRSFV
jgi:hypothetical protein